MKLNPDCIRDVLLYLEENLTYNHEREYGIEHNSITMTTIVEDLQEQNGYESDDIKYSIEKLLEINYIISDKITTGSNRSIIHCSISDISYNGHQFLNTIRPESIWDATKRGASKLGLMSIHALSNIATKITDKIIAEPEVITKIISML